MRHAFIAFASSVVVAALAAEARAADIHVPGDFRRLQDALNAAEPGDRVVVHRGTHRGPFGVLGDGIEIEGKPGARLVGVRGSTREAGLPALVVLGDGVAVRGITFVRGGVRIVGAGASVAGCTFRRIRDTIRTTSAISVQGAEAVVADNVLGPETSTFAAIWVEGDFGTVTGNRVDGRHVVFGISVTGADATVADNDLLLGDVEEGIQPQGITVVGDGATATSNVIENGDFTLVGDGAVVEGNSVTGSGLGFAGVYVEGSDSEIRFNRVRASLDTAVNVVGDRNRIEANEAVEIGSVIGGVRFGHGFVARGSDNLLRTNDVRACLGEGIRLAGGMGNSVEECRVVGAFTCGLCNRATGSSVTGSIFYGNSIDVVDLGDFVLFEDNNFMTGGPGEAGPGDPEVTDTAQPDNY